MNDGWFEILLKDDKQEIIIYLSGLVEGSTYNFKEYGVANLIEPPSGNYAVASLVRDNRIFKAQSGEITLLKGKGSKIEATFNFTANSFQVKGGEVSAASVNFLETGDCLLRMVNSVSAYHQYIYGSRKQVVFELISGGAIGGGSFFYIIPYHYLDGVIWPSQLNAEGRVREFEGTLYSYDTSGKLILIEDKYASNGEIVYTAEGNLVKTSIPGHRSTEVLYYLTYDDKKNPYSLLAKSVGGRPFAFSLNNSLSSLSRVNGSATAYSDVDTYQTTMYNYNLLGYPTTAVTNPGAQTITYEYSGCK